MGELILVEHFVHCVSGVDRIWLFRGGCLWGHIVVISGRGDGRSTRLCEEQGVRLGSGLMGGNGIVYSGIHGAGLDSVCNPDLGGVRWGWGRGAGGSGGLDGDCIIF